MAKPDVLIGTTAAYTLTIEIRRPHSGSYVVLVAKGRGSAGSEVLVAMELCGVPVSLDVMAEFESAMMCALEDKVARMVGLQELLGLE